MRTPFLSILAATLLAGCSGDLHRITGLSHPESVLHDTAADAYLVSNVVGEAMDRDGVGFISRIDAATLSVQLEFIRSGSHGVVLNAPKGMAIVGDVLFVADIDCVRRFDRNLGTPLGDIEVPGARSLNGMCNDADGNVYIGDTGWTAATAATGGDALWRLAADGTLRRLAHGAGLGEPNGLCIVDGSLHWVSWADGALQRLGRDGVPQRLRQLPHAQLDGVVHLHEGSWIYSSWQSGAVHLFEPRHGSRRLTTARGCAGFGFDRARRRLLLPQWYEGQLRIRAL